tara:strand:- start:96 stop:1049 length:954 start_codon:yes stop_codon:yes gene_type:complete
MNDFYILSIFLIILLILLIYLQNREKYYNWMVKFKKNELNLEDFFFKDIQHLKKSSKRKIWIHIPTDKNARKWESFSSRNTHNLNADYIALCIKSIIDHCGQYYDIIIIDDEHLYNLLPEHNIDLSKLSGSLLDKYRHNALLHILYKYGGILMPPSLFLRDSIYKIDEPNKFYVVEMANQGQHSTMEDFIYSTQFMASNANNPILGAYLNEYSESCLKDLTLENDHFNHQILKKMDIPKLDGKYIGVKNIKNEKILLEDLMESKQINLCNECIGLYIPHRELMKRNNYNWFVYLNPEQVLESNIFISKFMIYSNKYK